MKLATKEYKNLLSKQKTYNSKMTELNKTMDLKLAKIRNRYEEKVQKVLRHKHEVEIIIKDTKFFISGNGSN